MKIIIDGKDAALGRLASYAAKQALKGEDVVIVNCKEIIITGSKKNIREDFDLRRGRVGTTQQGPKVPRTSEKILKRAIRGMLPDHREGRGKVAFRKIICYSNIPPEFKEVKKMSMAKKFKNKFVTLRDFAK